MPAGVEIGSVVVAIVAVILLTASATRAWVRSTLRMDLIERDLLNLRERVTLLERVHAPAS